MSSSIWIVGTVDLVVLCRLLYLWSRDASVRRQSLSAAIAASLLIPILQPLVWWCARVGAGGRVGDEIPAFSYFVISYAIGALFVVSPAIYMLRQMAQRVSHN